MQHIDVWVSRIIFALNVEQDRWPLFIPVLLGLGIGGYFALPYEPALAWSWGVVVLLAVAVWWGRDKRAVLIVGVALLCMVLGAALAGLRTWSVAAPVLLRETGPVSISGQVEALEPQAHGQRVSLSRLRISRLAPDRTPNLVRIKLSGTQPSFAPGDWLEVRASLRPPPPPAMPGAFDFQRQSYFKGLGGVGFAYGAAKVVGHAPSHGWDSVRFHLQAWRLQIATRVRAHLGAATGAVGAALMSGVRGAIPEEVLEDMRVSGLAHLLAISGLHVGLVAGMVFLAVRAVLALIPPIALYRPIKKWAALSAIGAAFVYAVMAGATVPTLRAFLMIALMFFALTLDRRAISLRSVAWAAVVLLVFAPESLLGASFQMSFAAAVALVAGYEELTRRGWMRAPPETWGGRLLRYLFAVAFTTVIAGAATGLFAAYHFNRVADFGLAANMVAVPVMALWVMPWAMVAYVLMPLGLDGAALTVMGWGIEAILAVAHHVAAWPGAVSLVPAFPVESLSLLALGGVSLCLWRGQMRWMATPLMLGGLVLAALQTPPDIIVHQDGELAAVRTAEGRYAFSTLRSAKFERDVWLRRAGLGGAAQRWRGKTEDTIRCDALGCVFAKGEGAVAFVTHPEALREDCAKAGLVFNLSGERRCSPTAPDTGASLSRADLRRGGTVAVWLSDTGRVRRLTSVSDLRGNRPWVLQSGAKAQR